MLYVVPGPTSHVVQDEWCYDQNSLNKVSRPKMDTYKISFAPTSSDDLNDAVNYQI